MGLWPEVPPHIGQEEMKIRKAGKCSGYFSCLPYSKINRPDFRQNSGKDSAAPSHDKPRHQP
jgi:hypothetical protein